MDKRLPVIIAVLVVEILIRVFSRYVSIDGLTYTLIARAVQLAIILGASLDLCGIKTKSLLRELGMGFVIAAGFALAVFLGDLASRLFVPGGILTMLIRKQYVRNPAIFFLVGCLFAPLVEELFFRGLIYTWLRRRLPVIAAVLISALLFASMHGFLAPIQLIGGIAFAVVFEWRRNIWAAYVLHVLANTGIWLFPYAYPMLMRMVL